MILLRHGQSEFNVIYSVTRVDPGIPDPELTALGREQAAAAARALADHDLGRVVCSPYVRAIQTAEIVAEILGLAITIEPLVRERHAFICDIGSDPAILAARWPALDFAHLDRRWWPEDEESQADVDRRCRLFNARATGWDDHDRVVAVSHWGFIMALTGISAGNAEIVPHSITRAG